MSQVVIPNKVRVSVGNIVPCVRVQNTENRMLFGLYNRKKWAKGEKVVTALGGAATVTPTGFEFLKQKYGAEFQESGKDEMDARFVVQQEILENVFLLFEKRDPGIYEIDGRREVVEELTQEEWWPIQSDQILTASDCKGIGVIYLATVRQPKSSGGVSSRENEMHTRRIFNVFELLVPQTILEKLQAAKPVKFLTIDEVATTNGGRNAGRAEDGSILGDNLFLF